MTSLLVGRKRIRLSSVSKSYHGAIGASHDGRIIAATVLLAELIGKNEVIPWGRIVEILNRLESVAA
jgi:hypothetical protein